MIEERIITNKNLLYPELNYQLQEAIFEVANKYGKGLKESIYQKALAEELTKQDILYEEQKRIKIHPVTPRNLRPSGRRGMAVEGPLSASLGEAPAFRPGSNGVHSLDTGKVLGTYIPDFIVDKKMIIELKASNFSGREDILQQQGYLKASIYEVAYLVNFGTPKLFIKRSIYTNDRKPFIVKLTKLDS